MHKHSLIHSCRDKQHRAGEGTPAAVCTEEASCLSSDPTSSMWKHRNAETGLGKSRRQCSGYRRPADRASARDPLRRSPSSAAAPARASSASPGPSGAAEAAVAPAGQRSPAGSPRTSGRAAGAGAPSRGYRGAGAASHGRPPRGRLFPMPRSPLPEPPAGRGPWESPALPRPAGVPALPTPRGVSAAGAGAVGWPGEPRPLTHLCLCASSAKPPPAALCVGLSNPGAPG